MSQPENAWAIAEELMSQNMLDVPIHVAAPVIAKVLASRAPAKENEEGMSDTVRAGERELIEGREHQYEPGTTCWCGQANHILEHETTSKAQPAESTASLRQFLATLDGEVMLASLKTIGVDFICDQAGPGWINRAAQSVSEYERGRRDGRLEEAKWWANGSGNAICPRTREAYTARWAELRAATSGTPTEMYLCEINHLILHSDQPYIFRKHPDCYECNKYLAHGTPAEHNPARAPHNKFASLWCDACPRPTSGTTNVREAFEKWYAAYKDITPYIDGMQDAFEAGYNARSKERDAQAAPGPKCSHGVLMREFCQGCEDAGHAEAPGGKGPTPDWCDVCNASQMVVEDGEHICGLTAYEAYSLGWRRGNNASTRAAGGSMDKTTHKITQQDWHYSGYGDEKLVRRVPRCSCGEWLHTPKEVLEHKVEVLWEER